MILSTIYYSVGGTLLTGNKHSMQNRLENQIQESADKMYLLISRSKDNTYSKFPMLKEEKLSPSK